MFKRLLEARWLLEPGATRQDVDILEGRVRARGLQQAYWSALMLATGCGLSGLGRIGESIANASLQQRHEAALRALGQ